MSEVTYNNETTANWGKISRNYHQKKKAMEITFKVCRTILLFGMCFLIIQPLLDKLSVSFMAEQDLYDSTVISIPRNFTTNNYKVASDLIRYWDSLFQTFLIVTISSVLQIAACTLAAYGFARYKFPLKGFWFFCVMLIIVVPPHTIMASLYLNFHFFDIFGIFRLITGEPINLLNNVVGYWLLSATGMGLKSGLYIFMLRQYFRGMPKELEEAAWVDGCGKFKTFIRIMLPDATPMLTSCFLFSFVWQWTDSFFSTLFLRNYSMLSSGLGSIAERITQWWAQVNSVSGAAVASTAPVGYVQAMIATGMLMCLAPLIILYLVAQKAFVESLSQTGIKM
ncbi:MAG: carbohydrate ABC transporter permease [Treponema sp.]|nr:carbohydrate ABC transporter permease [Treponema sp.]MCL2236875.1 carbohydrate ABC transporter permease [Treponema sp.]